MEALKQLFEQHFGSAALRVQPVQGGLGGSGRVIVRLANDEHTAIGVMHDVPEENAAFLEFSRHFRAHGLPVPEIYGADEAAGAYLEEDLGDTTLFQFLAQHRRGVEIAPEVVSAYRKVHELGFISTVGTYRDGRLVGGMWGMTVGRTLGIQSMFHLESDAGSLALVAVLERMMAGDKWSVVDSVLLSDHFERFGAREILTEEFCELVWRSMLPADSAGRLGESKSSSVASTPHPARTKEG